MHSPSLKINRSLTSTRVRCPYRKLQTEFFFLSNLWSRQRMKRAAIKPTEKKDPNFAVPIWKIRTWRSEDDDSSENVAFKVNSLFFNLHPEWFKNYRHDRQQCVRIGSEMSGMRISTHGVPQGSTLGPALFNVYINDMPGVPDYCSVRYQYTSLLQTLLLFFCLV